MINWEENAVNQSEKDSILIDSTANKIQHMSPYLAQTGPGIRNDKKTIKKHLKLIEKPLYKDLYELLTKSIKNTHGIKKL